MQKTFYTCCNNPIQFIFGLFNPSTSWRRFLLTIFKQICLWTTLFIIPFGTIIPEITYLGLKNFNIQRSINVFISKYIKVFLLRIVGICSYYINTTMIRRTFKLPDITRSRSRKCGLNFAIFRLSNFF